jgi:hypothetical protein
MGATFDLLSTDPVAPVCSRAGCPETAVWRVNWRNPRIHAADRVKVWAACDEHRGFLADYLRSRAFPVAVTDIHEDVDRLEDVTDTADAGHADAARSDAGRADVAAGADGGTGR